jgi:hypothetical protein
LTRWIGRAHGEEGSDKWQIAESIYNGTWNSSWEEYYPAPASSEKTNNTLVEATWFEYAASLNGTIEIIVDPDMDTLMEYFE